MKRSIFLALFILLIPLPAVAQRFSSDILGDVRINVDGITSKPVTETIDDLTLYVRSTGNDNNTCLASTNACLTIQEAVDRIPSQIGHDVTIDIGEGNFAGFTVAGFTVPRYVGTLLIKGTLSAALDSGTADGGSTTQCVDSGKGWTPDAYRGKLVKVGVEYRVVRNNTATELNLVGPLAATCNGQAYEIVEHSTVVNSASPDYASANIWVTSNQTGRDNGIEFSDIKTTGNTYAIFNQFGDGMKWVRIHSTNSTAQILLQSIGGESILEDCYTEGGYYGFGIVEIAGQVRAYRNYDYGSSYGFYLAGNGAFSSTNDYMYSDEAVIAGIMATGLAEVFLEHVSVKDSNGAGVILGSSSICSLYNVEIKSNTGSGIINLGTPVTLGGVVDISDNGGYGIETGGNIAPINVFIATPSVEIAGAATIENNTSGGILARYISFVKLGNVDGTNTGAYGLTLETGSYATITTATGLTGATGDATINDGTATLTWVTHFNDNGDIAVNGTNGCRIERKD